jgi:hypothetical protein
MQSERKPTVIIVIIILIASIIAAPFIFFELVKQTTSQALQPISDANNYLKTQVTDLLHPTPTIIADPVTIIHEVRSLARLETIQYSVEKVITAELGQGQFSFLFGDKLLFVAHGVVIAGLDMEKLRPEDLKLEGKTLYATLPQAEVFIATLDNEKSYVFDRQTGLLTHGDTTLETQARQVAEQEILKAAVADGILKIAQENGENYLSRLFRGFGYNDVIFLHPTPTP